MLASSLYMPTLKDTPADAELISHQYMLRAGLIRKSASGIYTWLPLGLKVLKRIENIVREEMEIIHSQEVMMPAIQASELWKETSRWDAFGPQLLKIKDRHKRWFCFGPTHEEIITDLLRGELKSYKQLPLSIFQIQTKFRDEIRPRFGVMRAREFLMKDAYSFHIEDRCFKQTYEAMRQAYQRICERIGFSYRIVAADSGSIGGNKSEEFHVLATSGEDIIVSNQSGRYVANIEKACCYRAYKKATKPKETLRLCYTPASTMVEEQTNIPINKILKTILVKGVDKKYPIIALLIRGDHKINPVKAENHPLIAAPLNKIHEAQVKKMSGCKPDFVGPINLNVPLIADPDVLVMSDFACGSNKDDNLYLGVNWQRDCPMPKSYDIRFVQKNDKDPIFKEPLQFSKGIEIAHIFQLGTKYSENMNFNVLDKQGNTIPVRMGCYGMGISRMVAASIEQHHDDKGIIWPENIAPFKVVILPIQANKHNNVYNIAKSLYNNLLHTGIDVLFENRKRYPGEMFGEMDLIGIPHRLVISQKSLSKDTIEYKRRFDNTVCEIALDNCLAQSKNPDFISFLNKIAG